jgi:predicted dehydrogenase
MKIGVIGCGYVFDTYMGTVKNHPSLEVAGVADIDMERARTVGRAYKLRVYETNDELLRDPEIELVVNLTSIGSHFEVTMAALRAGKHVYSEKPLTTNFDDARNLLAYAESRGLLVGCAFCYALSDTSQTMWKAVLDGAIGEVRLLYAELDDNPIYLMHPEYWRSRTGAPWPYVEEYEQGCTYEHVGYHLTWMCSMFGPVETVTAFSKCTIPNKTTDPLDPPDTPDFSVACLNFRSGVVARVTCSIVAPYDHQIRIIGDKGMLTADTYRHYRCPVYLERFTQLSLNARKAVSVRHSRFLQWLFGVGGKRVPLVRNPLPGSHGARVYKSREPRSLRGLITRLKQRELGLQDKCLGIAELADAIASKRAFFPPPDFTLHLTELTVAIQGALTRAGTHILQTTFAPIAPERATLENAINYNNARGRSVFEALVDRVLVRMHDRSG